MSTFEQVIRSAGERAARLAVIAERQRDFDAICRLSAARVVASDRGAAALIRQLSGSRAARWGGWGVTGGGNPG